MYVHVSMVKFYVHVLIIIQFHTHTHTHTHTLSLSLDTHTAGDEAVSKVEDKKTRAADEGEQQHIEHRVAERKMYDLAWHDHRVYE